MDRELLKSVAVLLLVAGSSFGLGYISAGGAAPDGNAGWRQKYEEEKAHRERVQDAFQKHLYK